MTKVSIPSTDEAWDDETLGADPQSMKAADNVATTTLDEAAGTQLISIRMSKSMVDAFKAIAIGLGMCDNTTTRARKNLRLSNPFTQLDFFIYVTSPA